MPILKLLGDHHKIFGERFARIDILNLGEDAIRYDFFHAVIDRLKLKPWDIHIEQPMQRNSYVSMKNTGSFRMENPKIDLKFQLNGIDHYFEFGLFKRNGNIDGNINVTARTFKMLNDFMRLAILNALNNNSKSYFICVADEKLIGHKLSQSDIPHFPSDQYYITVEKMKDFIQRKSGRTQISQKFFARYVEIGGDIVATKIFEESFDKGVNLLETRLIGYEIILKR